jgi:hypothetical protein
MINESTFPVNFGTPPRKRQHFAMQQHPAPYQQRKEHSQGRLSLAKSTSQPSTVGSPFIRPSTQRSIFDIELNQPMDIEYDDKCSNFFGKGQCERGLDCEDAHCQKVIRRASKLEKLANFPELMEVERMLRVRSFLA